MSSVNPKVTAIALPVGVFTAIVMTITASKVQITEDPAQNNGAPQGLTGYLTDTQPATGNPNVGEQMVWLANTAGQRGFGFQPIELGGADGRVMGPEGEFVGAQGTIVARLQPNGPNATGVLLVEWP